MKVVIATAIVVKTLRSERHYIAERQELLQLPSPCKLLLSPEARYDMVPERLRGEEARKCIGKGGVAQKDLQVHAAGP